MIERFKNANGYNPIREHIKLDFQFVKDDEDKIGYITNDLTSRGFNPEISRVLIFVSQRKHAEEAIEKIAYELQDLNKEYAQKVDYYHAGLESVERESRYEKYISGEIVILVATKAFGMGMDIPNIHYVYHLGPSSNFEDFLQEVGRAGRNEKSYINAGFSTTSPILSKCLVSSDDFRKLKDKLHKSQITWVKVVNTHSFILEYIKKFAYSTVNGEKPFPLPLDLFMQAPDYERGKDSITTFKIILYWLERFKKIKLGTYTSTHIPINILENEPNFSTVKKKGDVRKLQDFLKKVTFEVKGEKGFYMVPMAVLKKLLNVDSFSDVWSLLFMGQKANALKIEREIQLSYTDGKSKVLEACSGECALPTIEAVFNLVKDVLYVSRYNQQMHFEGSEIDQMIAKIINEHLGPSKVFWNEERKNVEKSKDEIAESLQVDFKKKRVRSAFKIINFLPKAKHKSIIEFESDSIHPVITQLIYNGYKKNADWENYLERFKQDLLNLIFHVHNQVLKGDNRRFNIVDLMIHLNIESHGEQYFSNLVYVAKGLGFLKGPIGGLIPMGIELFLLDKAELPYTELSDFELKIKAEFDETNKMKELRMLALEGLSKIDSSKNNEFIKAYFECGSSTDFIQLLEEFSSNNPELLSRFRSEALEKAKKQLNPEQMLVYNAELDTNLQVIAGPGSGKTHTLTLRVARLIQEEKVQPENILVLAYNRAVVVELKDRLNKLFSELGYSKLIKRLKVFTFHGFCKYCLGRELDGVDFDQWAQKFLEVAKNSPGKISQKLGLVKYVFVDEFQDITNERLKLLKHIAAPNSASVCVIGDPNQSIYGYERVNEGGVMSPEPYYEMFKKIYEPVEYFLSVNYRSYSQILDSANELLTLNTSKFEMPKLAAYQTYSGDSAICEFYDYNTDKINWKDKLHELVNYVRENGENYKIVAVMFRSNQEVYKAFNDLRKMSFPGVRLRVQGSKGSLYSTREFHYFLEEVKRKESAVLESGYFEHLKELKGSLLSEKPNWDEYLINVFLCIAYEFKKEQDEDSSYNDLYDFVLEISSKDDGHFGKIYQQNMPYIFDEEVEREIVLTTMHKVKGIEYDAVLVPPSFSNLPLRIDAPNQNLADIYEEERRLYYVAYTRAKYKLVVIKWRRENSLYGKTPVLCEILSKELILKNLGVLLPEGIDKYVLYWGASNYGNNAHQFIANQVKIGDEVKLVRKSNSYFDAWYVEINNTHVAQLSRAYSRRLIGNNLIEGFMVSAIYTHTYEETINSEKGSKFAEKWNSASIKRGFIYIVDFSGYGKIIN